MSFGPAPVHHYTYPAALVRVIDGDTVVLVLDHGMHCRHQSSVRLAGVNAPELRGLESAAGQAARTFVADWLAEAEGTGWAWPLLVVSKRLDKYGRPEAVVYRMVDLRCLNDDLVTAGHAVIAS